MSASVNWRQMLSVGEVLYECTVKVCPEQMLPRCSHTAAITYVQKSVLCHLCPSACDKLTLA